MFSSGPRIRVAMAGVVSGVLVLTGCGTAFQDDPVEEDASLVYWASWNDGEPQQVIMDRIIEDFVEETGIEVEVEYMGRQVTQTLINALDVGDGPDLFDAGTRNIMDFHDRGFLADLTPLLDLEIPGESLEVRETFADSIIESSQVEGELAILPTYINSNAIWYNAARFPELSDNPPETWDDFIMLLDEHEAEGLIPVGADGTVAGYNIFWFFQNMIQLGGPGALRELGEDAANWDRSEVLESAQRVQQLVEGDYLDSGYMGSRFPDAQNRWANDEYSFMLNGSYMGGETQDQQADGFEADTFLFPAADDGSRTLEVTANGLAVSSDTAFPDAAHSFLAFAAQNQYQSMWATEAGFIGARADVDPPEALVSLNQHIQEADSVTGAHDLAGSMHPAWWNDVMLPLHDALFGGEIDAATFVERGREETAALVGSGD